MVIDVRQLNAQKRYTGTLEFSVEGESELIDIPFVEFASPVKIQADYELFEDDALELKGKISFWLKGQCSRCLKDAQTFVEGEIDALFEPFEGGEDYSNQNGKIDLTEAIREAVMASMPKVLSCGDACEGIKY